MGTITCVFFNFISFVKVGLLVDAEMLSYVFNKFFGYLIYSNRDSKLFFTYRANLELDN